MKKKLCLAATALLLLLCGCSSEVSTGGSDNAQTDKTYDIDKAAEEVKNGITFEDSLSQLDTDVALSYYGISSEDVKDSVVMISTGATSEEIAIFEAVDAEKVQTVKTACEARRNKQIDSYNDYKPSEISRLNGAIIKEYGNYVVYCVVDDNIKAEEILDNYFK